jgi:hypothetical protein
LVFATKISPRSHQKVTSRLWSASGTDALGSYHADARTRLRGSTRISIPELVQDTDGPVSDTGQKKKAFHTLKRFYDGMQQKYR